MVGLRKKAVYVRDVFCRDRWGHTGEVLVNHAVEWLEEEDAEQLLDGASIDIGWGRRSK